MPCDLLQQERELAARAGQPLFVPNVVAIQPGAVSQMEYAHNGVTMPQQTAAPPYPVGSYQEPLKQ
jgi:hypothetical protein